MALLEIRNLSVDVGRGHVPIAAVNGVDLALERGEVLGLVGESGAGKTMLARAVTGLLPAVARPSGQVLFEGRDVLTMGADELERHRGRGAAFCFQQPRRALSPVRRVGDQLTDRLRNQNLRSERADEQALELFRAVGIQNPGPRLRSFPHELSGGMVQRVMISLALACSPAVLLADEPTTGLDVTLTRSILRLLRQAATEQNRAVLLISHDLAAIAEVCDRIAVMYAGTIVEEGPIKTVLARPAHPYTISLLAAAPDISGGVVMATPGAMPTLHARPSSCPFSPRCPIARERCAGERPPLMDVGNQRAACFFAGDLEATPRQPLTGAQHGSSKYATSGRLPERPFVEATGVEVVFGARFARGGFKALHGVDLTVGTGQTLGIVGESGCGKTTLGRALVGLVKPSAGGIRVGDVDIAKLRGPALRRYRLHMQMVFQDPIESLNPRRTVEQTLCDSMALLKLPSKELQSRVTDALLQVGLDPALRTRRRDELSGGQAQRVGIARALAVDPQLIVFDEPTSALDVTVQAQILELIASLMSRRNRSYVFISHDLAIVRSTCDSIAVLYLGRIVEQGSVESVFTRPLHPYTHALLASVSSLQDTQAGNAVELKRELETTVGPGCPLATRCPFTLERCSLEEQKLIEHDPGHFAACWRASEIDVLTPKRIGGDRVETVGHSTADSAGA